jgi:mono/diheme cytochrome c family protein
MLSSHSTKALLRGGTGALILLFAAAAAAEGPKLSYMLNCMGCHQSDGAGVSGKIPALKKRMGLFLQVPGGREYLVQVPGTAQSSLDDSEVAEVLNWMLREFSPDEMPADFNPYTEAEVARIRTPLVYVSPTRKRLLAAIERLERD